MRRLLALALLFCSGPAHAQVTQAQVSAAIATQLPSGGQINAASLRSVLELMNTAVFQPQTGPISIVVPPGFDAGLTVNQQPTGTCVPTGGDNFCYFNVFRATNYSAATGLNNNIGYLGADITVNGNASSGSNGCCALFGSVGRITFQSDAGMVGGSSYAGALAAIRVLQSPTAEDFFGGGDNCNVVSVAGIVWPVGSQFICHEADVAVASPGLAGRAMYKIVVADNPTPGNLNVQGSSFDALIYAQSIPGASQFGYRNGLQLDGTFGQVIATNGCGICFTGGIVVSSGIDISGFIYSQGGNPSNGVAFKATPGTSINGLGQVFAAYPLGGGINNPQAVLQTVTQAGVGYFQSNAAGVCTTHLALFPNVGFGVTAGALNFCADVGDRFAFYPNSMSLGATSPLIIAGTGLTIGIIPTSAGGGGLNVCIDTAGVLYKKAACP